MIAIGTLLLIVGLSLLITRIATVILTASGMSREAARFQARSAFTGAGFTTRESEGVVGHPLRRRVISTLMLLGSVGVVAAASTAILGFRAAGLGRTFWRLLILGVGLLTLVFLSRSAWVDRRLTAAIKRLIGRFTTLPTRDVAGLLDLAGDYAVGELAVQSGDWLAGRSLAELSLRDEGVAVLGITRPDGGYLSMPDGSTTIAAGDLLVVYGRSALLGDLDDRPVGSDGDLAHEAAVSRQSRLQTRRRESMPDQP